MDRRVFLSGLRTDREPAVLPSPLAGEGLGERGWPSMRPRRLCRRTPLPNPLPQGEREPGRRLLENEGGKNPWRWLMILLCSTLVFAGYAAAAPIPFPPQPLDYDLHEEPLPTFLERFFADQGIRAQLSPGVQSQSGTLNGPRRGMPEQVFRSVLDSFRLAAYYDGATVHVVRRDELVSRFFVVQPAQIAPFLAAVRQLGLSNEYNSVRVTEDTGLVSASGAPHFVDQIAQVAEAIGQRRDPVDTVFRFFALKHAWAADRTMVVGNRQVTIPGVATILQQLLDERVGYGAEFQNEVVLPARAPSLNGQGLASLGSGLRAQPSRVLMPDANGGLRMGEVQPPSNPGLVSIPAGGGGVARIVADPYRNAVIVRDLPERIGLYEELIRSLDTENAILEIEATIIDVDTDKLRSLGVEWRAGTKSAEAVFGEDGSKDDFLGALASGNIAALGQVPGFQIGAIIGDDDRFIARVNALQQEGAMRIVSRPQVVTINDVEAVIESSRQVYVPVQGAYQVDLFNVFAGTVLRVTPHRIADDARERIRLLVAVEDGDVRLTPSDVQNVEIPEVTRNAVNTQAVIEAGQSLLLGGLIREQANTTVTKVPLLGDIPLIGELFKSRSRDAAHTERLFLITPRILDQNRQQILPVPVPELGLESGRRPPPQNIPPAPPPLPPELAPSLPDPEPVAQKDQGAEALAPPPAPLAGTVEPPDEREYLVLPERGMYMRSAPSLASATVGTLSPRQRVQSTGRHSRDEQNRDWIELTATMADGRFVVGWARSGFLKPQPDDAAANAETRGEAVAPPGGGATSMVQEMVKP
jgi:type III secretion protein C